MYLIRIKDKKKDVFKNTGCKTDEEFATLLMHLDSNYKIEDIAMADDLEDYKNFCKTDTKLETGGK